jgi:prepilin peptidase CpaA
MHQLALTFIFCSLLAFCVTAVCFDLRFGRIPNIFNALGFAAGTLISWALLGLRGLCGSLCGAALGLVIMILPFLLHMVGGGDVKFLSAAGSIVGFQVLWPSFLAGAALGGAIGLFLLVARDKSLSRLRCRLVLLQAGCWRRRSPALSLAKPGLADVRFPYSIPLSIGLVAVTSIKLCIR